MVFEEVGDEAEDFTYKDPVEEMTKTILGLEQEVAALQEKAATTGRADKRALEVARVRLAEERYKRQAHHESQGRSKKGEVDRLLKELQAAQDQLEALNNSQIADARAAALKRFDRGSTKLTPDDIAQLRRHRRAA